MQTPTFPALQSRYKNSAANSFLATHAIGEVVRSLFLSSIGWVLVACAVYAVYTMVVGKH
jgi:hypothetical protein